MLSARFRAASMRRLASGSLSWSLFCSLFIEVDYHTMTQPRKEYPAANVCIYCGDRNPPLGEEHIIPFGLNGNLIIPSASCKKCEKETGYIERLCLRGMFGPYRVRHGFKSRNPKDRARPFPLKLFDKDDNEQTIDLPLADHPTTIALPDFDPPNILSGKPPPDPDAISRWRIIFIGSTSDLEKAKNIAAEPIWTL